MFSRNDNKLIDLVWSPFNSDEFIAYANDICLFKIRKMSNDTEFGFSDVDLIANYGENSNPKQVSWYLGSDHPNFYAVSLSNYKIQLISYNSKNEQKSFQINKEFAFKQVRQCTHLVWNSKQTNILAGGFEKVRNEHSILVWDIRGNSTLPINKLELGIDPSFGLLNYNLNRQSNYQSSYTNLNCLMNEYKAETFKPVYETGNTDTCNSLAWNPDKENILFAGLSGKYLKMFDIKSTDKSFISTKYVQGFTFDPKNSFQAASYLDNCVVLWDIRMFNSPIYKIDETEPVSKIQWCPTKSGQLAVLTKSSVNLYRVRSFNNSLSISVLDDQEAPVQILVDKISRKCSMSSENSDPKPVNKTSNPNFQTQTSQTLNSLTNFCWFNSDSNKILITFNYLISNIKTMSLFDTIALTWSPNGNLYWSSNLGKMNHIEIIDRSEFNFLKELKDRAQNDYGLKYYIISIINGSTTMTSSIKSLEESSTSANGCQATPLALRLHSQIGLNHLIRTDFMHNYRISDSDSSDYSKNLKFLWFWLESVNYFFEKTIPIIPKNTSIEIGLNCRNSLSELYSIRYCGLKILLNDLESVMKKSDSYELKQIRTERFKVIAYNLCGWEMKDGVLSQSFFTTLKTLQEFERACFLALLTDNYEQALDILDSASQIDPSYGSLWITVRYFIDDNKLGETYRPEFAEQTSPCSLDDSISTSNSFHSNQTSQTSNKKSPFFSINSSGSSTTPKAKQSSGQMTESFLKESSKLIQSFTHPYLKALFNFLINKEKSIMEILFDRNILFQDRIALSIHYLLDLKNLSHLQVYFDKLIEEECMANSDLSGVLLTGLGPKAIDLFQTFIDKTGDLQSICLAIIHSPYLDVLDSSQVNYWITSFREQLNKFKLWEKRAEFDILKMKLRKFQSLTNASEYTKPTLHTEALSEPNLPSSSSSTSSLSSMAPLTRNGNSLNVPLKNNSHSFHQIYNNQQTIVTQNRQNNQSMILIATNINMGINQRNSQSMHIQNNLTTPAQQNANMTVYYNCNKCGKNLLEKSQNSSCSFTSNNLNTMIQSINSQAQSNEVCLNGCLNCCSYLPQCTVCLRLMKINLTPNPINSSTNGINRVQTTPKLHNPNYHHQSKKLSVQYKSGQIDLGSNRNFFLEDINENHFAFQRNKNDHDNYRKERRSLEKFNAEWTSKIEILYYENFSLLKYTKFGNWFSWCQTCHHGGHIKHLIYWFKSNKKCPYLHCKCYCTDLDCLF
ncbi:unnamed protein product [Brachionus calyciflorus]|uniref:Uncharacterized protein n=1 Tax=Brachionus calyciflorus TaxID=104777 RepID=A0A813VEK8_9BILA|nr:unnamed protein product [Brachionus calyciflorus]